MGDGGISDGQELVLGEDLLIKDCLGDVHQLHHNFLVLIFDILLFLHLKVVDHRLFLYCLVLKHHLQLDVIQITRLEQQQAFQRVCFIFFVALDYGIVALLLRVLLALL